MIKRVPSIPLKLSLIRRPRKLFRNEPPIVLKRFTIQSATNLEKAIKKESAYKNWPTIHKLSDAFFQLGLVPNHKLLYGFAIQARTVRGDYLGAKFVYEFALEHGEHVPLNCIPFLLRSLLQLSEYEYALQIWDEKEHLLREKSKVGPGLLNYLAQALIYCRQYERARIYIEESLQNSDIFLSISEKWSVLCALAAVHRDGKEFKKLMYKVKDQKVQTATLAMLLFSDSDHALREWIYEQSINLGIRPHALNPLALKCTPEEREQVLEVERWIKIEAKLSHWENLMKLYLVIVEDLKLEPTLLVGFSHATKYCLRHHRYVRAYYYFKCLEERGDPDEKLVKEVILALTDNHNLVQALAVWKKYKDLFPLDSSSFHTIRKKLLYLSVKLRKTPLFEREFGKNTNHS